MDALTNTTPKIDKTTGQPLRREWRKIKNEVVKKAIEEINTETDFDVSLTERKTGSAVTLVQFEIRPKKQEPREIQVSHFELIKTGLALGLTEVQVAFSIKRTSVEQVGLGLAKLEARLKNKELEPVTNLKRYFSSIISELAPVKVIDDVPAQAAPAPSPESESEKSVLTLAREQFMTLSEAEKRSYAARALEALVARGVVTPRVQRNAEEGIWSGILLSQMIEIFNSSQVQASIFGVSEAAQS